VQSAWDRRKPDRVSDAFGFGICVDIGIGEAGLGADNDARKLAAIARHDTIKHTFPAIGAVDVAGTKRAAFQIAGLVEHKQRVIADARLVPVPDAHRLLAMGRTDAGVHVAHKAARRAPAMNAVDPLA
jgi:hypothetical protein